MKNDLETLIEKCLAGEAEESERAELQRLISGSEEAMREYLARLDFLIDLREGVLRLAEKPEEAPRLRPAARSLPAARSAARPLRLIFGAAAAAAAIALGLLFLRPAPATADFLVDALPADAEILREGRPIRTASLLPGDQIRSGRSPVEIRPASGDASRLLLSPQSLLRIRPSAESPLALEGELLAEMAPQDRPFLIDTAEARIEVIGTRFQLRSRDGDSLLSVSRGRVAISTQGRRSEVTAGESLSSRQVLAGASPRSVAGLWDSSSGQIEFRHLGGDRFTGSYRDGNSRGHLSGRFLDGELAGTWEGESGSRGDMRFVFLPGEDFFIGTWNGHGQASRHPWIGSKSPASGRDFRGRWISDYGAMWIGGTADGRLIGTYSYPNPGRLEGRMTQDLWSGTWLNDNGASGSFELRLSSDARSFTGRWIRNPGGEKTSWTGTRDTGSGTR